MNRILIIALALITFNSQAQEFTFSKISQADYLFDRNEIDSNANAIYLNEQGTTRFLYDSESGRMKIIHDYHARIKIFNKAGFEAANIVIPMYKYGTANDQEEFVTDIVAVTHNYENGSPVSAEMSANAVFNEEKSQYLTLKKFTLPNLKENSIIEYKYRIESPYIFNFRTWEFQADFPKVNSIYTAYIPGNYSYNASLRGYQKLTDTKTEVSRGCLRVAGKEMDCSKLTYTMTNIPAFVEEDYMTSATNYKSAIYYELAEVHHLNGSTIKYTKTWKNVDYELTSDKKFGGQMKRKDAFKDIIPTVTAGLTTDLDKAKAIYEYIKKQIKWNRYVAKYSESNIRNVLDERTGNAADINLSLIAALSAAGIDTEAVILSTRSNGTVNKLYPVISDFNYVVAKANIDGKSYLLDATDPLMPFGLLPLRCINDQGRVINLKKASYWIDLKASKRSSTTQLLKAKLEPDGKITGVLTTNTFGYDAANTRSDIKRYPAVEDYVDRLDARLIGIQIKNFKIHNLDEVEKTLVEEYELEFSASDQQDKENRYFNPFLIKPIRTNPFKLKERLYPVDFGSVQEERVSINLELPESYKIKELPKDVSIGLPNNGGRFMLQFVQNGNNLVINQLIQLNKPVYSSEEYHALKELYNRIIQTHKTGILLTRAK